MKMRTIKLTSRFITDALQGKAVPFALNLPSDIELLDIKFSLSTNQLIAVVRSDSFEDIPETYPIPELTISYKPKIETASSPASSVKLEPKPASVLKPKLPTAPAKNTQTQSSQQTGKIENEFSPDQRELLSFKVNGENVIVKPVQFLKEEWEDINEVVRSLGGKWVKGDIISYWAIPLQQ
jgi:hypothetical protein